MKQIFTLLTTITLVGLQAIAGHGYFDNGGSFVTLRANNGADTRYKIGPSTAPGVNFFSGTNFGGSVTFLNLGLIEQNTYENGGDDVVNHGTFFYRMYPTAGGPSGLYSSVSISNAIYNNGGTGIEYRSITPNTDLIVGLMPATAYTLEIYFRNDVTYPSGGGFIVALNNPGGAGGNQGSAYNPGIIPVVTATFTTASILPLNLNSFVGAPKDDAVELRWSTLAETSITKFIIEKSINGVAFAPLADVAPKNIANGASYTYLDGAANYGNNYYRLVSKHNNGTNTYSRVIRVLYGKIDNTLTLFPNPAKQGDIINVNFVAAARGTYVLTILSDNGQRIVNQTLEHNGMDRIIKVTLPSTLKKGPYRLHIANHYEFFKGTFIVQ